MARWLGGIGEAYADRNFRIYSIGSLTSWITYFIQTIAFSWAAWEATRSTAWLAVVSALTVGASVVFLPIGSVLADRHDRFRLAMAAYGCDCVKALILAILAARGELTLVPIAVAALLHGVIHSFSVPASFGLMPRFVARDRLAAAIGVNASYTQFAIFAGPALAGWILVHFGVAFAFAVNVAGYCLYFFTMAMLRTPADFRQAAAPARSFASDLASGARYILAHRGLSTLMLFVLAADAVTASIYQMLPAYAETVLGKGAGSASLLYAAAGIGATLSALWLAHGGARRATPGRVLWAMAGLSLSLLLLSGVEGAIFAFAAMVLFGFSGETRRTGTVSILQSTVDDAKRGRVMGTQFLLTQLAGGIGTLAIGVSAERVGLRLPLLLAGLLLGLVWLAAHARRRAIAAAFASGV